MKLKILKLSLMFFFFAFAGTSCDKEEWEEIELNDNDCGEVMDILFDLNEVEGIVQLRPDLSSSQYFIIIHDEETGDETIFHPCNLPAKYHESGLKIIFAGEVVNVKDWVEDSSQPDFIGTPLKLLTAKIKR